MNKIPPTRFSDQSLKKHSIIDFLRFVALLSVILYFGKTLFIPLSIAMLISFLLYPPCSWMEKKGLHRSASIVIAILLLMVFAAAVIYLLVIQFINFYEDWDELAVKVQEVVVSLEAFLKTNFNVSIKDQHSWLEVFMNNSGSQVIPFLKSTTYSLSVVLVFFILVPILSALILYYRQLLLKALDIIFPGEYETVHKIMHDTVHSYYDFVKGMLIVYLIVGTLNSIGLAIIGIPHPVLFGFVASVLTVIPYVGIVVASLLPISVAWITYGSIWYPLGVIAVFSLVQFLEANVIFPFAVGNQLKVNTLAIIITIIAGGLLWGAAGMILFIPFIGILKLIADRTESLKIISVLLGTEKKEKKKKAV